LTTTVIDDAQAPSADPDLAQAQQWGRDYADRLRTSATARLSQPGSQQNGSSGAAHPHLGEPTVNQYVAFDVAASSPQQPIGLPPYQPGKIIAAGEPAYLNAWGWVNPFPSIPDGFAVPPATQLAGRSWRITLDLLNITTGARVSIPQTGTFGSPADPIVPVTFLLPTPDPGLDSAVYEANVTFDIVDPGQPYAAFATTFIDYDGDPGDVFAPPIAPGWRRDLPNRFLVYQQ
jgi:hypothetical protein